MASQLRETEEKMEEDLRTLQRPLHLRNRNKWRKQIHVQLIPGNVINSLKKKKK